jgi:hypothetical protein
MGAIEENQSSERPVMENNNIWRIRYNEEINTLLKGEDIVINYINLYSGGGSPSWVPSTRRPLNGLLYLPWVIMMMENLVE